MRLLGISNSAGLCVSLAIILVACDSADNSTDRVLGRSWEIGNGTVSTYAEIASNGIPAVIGIEYSAAALDGLPSVHSDGHHCFDRDSDASIDPMTECLATHETVMPLPDAVAANPDIPFKWVMFNWNPAGHIPPGVYDVPHFDVHFYIDSIENVFALQDGPCGPEFIRCDQFERARKPLPANYMPPDYQNVDAVAPAMGNHLIDLTGPEFNGEKWTRNFIFGVYDGEVTFYEEMVTREYLLSQPDVCNLIKSPAAVGLAGYYPTRSCVRYDTDADTYTVSLEGFEHRVKSAPEFSAN
jgi:hypothetical protein